MCQPFPADRRSADPVTHLTEIGKEAKGSKSIDLETLLLNGLTATKKQLDTIAKNRKAINQWWGK